MLVLAAVGEREFCCMTVENRLEALYFVRSPRAAHSSRATNPRPSGLVALDLAESRQNFVALPSTESRQSYSRRRRWQNDIDRPKAAKLRGVALNGEPPKPQQA